MAYFNWLRSRSCQIMLYNIILFLFSLCSYYHYSFGEMYSFYLFISTLNWMHYLFFFILLLWCLKSFLGSWSYSVTVNFIFLFLLLFYPLYFVYFYYFAIFCICLFYLCYYFTVSLFIIFLFDPNPVILIVFSSITNIHGILFLGVPKSGLLSGTFSILGCFKYNGNWRLLKSIYTIHLQNKMKRIYQLVSTICTA